MPSLARAAAGGGLWRARARARPPRAGAPPPLRWPALRGGNDLTGGPCLKIDGATTLKVRLFDSAGHDRP
eukprot:2850647-Prymnesium_polylepis.1